MADVQPDFISIGEFCKRSSLSRSTVYAEIERGNLARPIRLSANRVAFPAKAVDAWFASRLAEAA
ncbi:AlpA family phage regulatory protein [Brevundimonas albigilva]|uniref:helix-turn-helix transcriptional regulator n=1 Tax=Brevundimonas albigilva TaxID=1312364 RepID=UPI00201B8764|nr:AlpA family phage regulatory protein [Brevundimonas albigilva]UQV19042.1 AlpA family phage regulatory protein [Brevundimonas albigilva]